MQEKTTFIHAHTAAAEALHPRIATDQAVARAITPLQDLPRCTCLVNCGNWPNCGHPYWDELEARKKNPQMVVGWTGMTAYSVHGSGLGGFSRGRNEVIEADHATSEVNDSAIPTQGHRDRPRDGLRDYGLGFAEMGSESGLPSGLFSTPRFEFHAHRLAHACLNIKRLLIRLLVALRHA